MILTNQELPHAPVAPTKSGAKSEQFVRILPENEGHLRPLLSDLKTDSERVTVWQNVVEASKADNVKITAKFVKTKVDEFVASGEIIECLDFAEIDTKINTGVTATLNTGDEEWYTPPKYIESARLVMGGIDLDPASNTWAQENVKAETYYTIHDNGLTKDWHGKVWMNPPYTARVINTFLEKITAHFEAGEITDAIVLTNNSADTSWFHKSARVASALCFTTGRINFLKPSGETSSPTNGQLFFYFGNDVAAFKNEFSQYGLVVVKA
jgi:ParB family chromosome partitioning protein